MSSEYTTGSAGQNDEPSPDIFKEDIQKSEDMSTKEPENLNESSCNNEYTQVLPKPEAIKNIDTLNKEFSFIPYQNERLTNEKTFGNNRYIYNINRGYDIMALATIAEIEYGRIATSQRYIPDNEVPVLSKRGRKRKYLGVPINRFEDASSDLMATPNRNMFGKFKIYRSPVLSTSVHTFDEGRSSDIDGVHLAGDTIIDKDKIHKYGDIPDTTFFTGWQDNVFVFICPYPRCNKSFPSISRAKRHFIIHTEAKPYKCPNAGCNKWFSRKDNMNQHCRVHCKFASREDQ